MDEGWGKHVHPGRFCLEPDAADRDHLPCLSISFSASPRAPITSSTLLVLVNILLPDSLASEQVQHGTSTLLGPGVMDEWAAHLLYPLPPYPHPYFQSAAERRWFSGPHGAWSPDAKCAWGREEAETVSGSWIPGVSKLIPESLSVLLWTQRIRSPFLSAGGQSFH